MKTLPRQLNWLVQSAASDEAYMEMKAVLNRKYFTPLVFAKLQQGDAHGRISVRALFNYVMRKVWQDQTRIGMSLYDTTGQGYLRESVSTFICREN